MPVLGLKYHTHKINNLDTGSMKSVALGAALHAGTSASVELDTTTHTTAVTLQQVTSVNDLTCSTDLIIDKIFRTLSSHYMSRNRSHFFQNNLQISLLAKENVGYMVVTYGINLQAVQHNLIVQRTETRLHLPYADILSSTFSDVPAHISGSTLNTQHNVQNMNYSKTCCTHMVTEMCESTSKDFISIRYNNYIFSSKRPNQIQINLCHQGNRRQQYLFVHYPSLSK